MNKRAMQAFILFSLRVFTSSLVQGPQTYRTCKIRNLFSFTLDPSDIFHSYDFLHLNSRSVSCANFHVQQFHVLQFHFLLFSPSFSRPAFSESPQVV